MTSAKQASRVTLVNALQSLLKAAPSCNDEQNIPAPVPRQGTSGSARLPKPGEEPYFCGSLEDAIEYLTNLGPLDARVSIFLSKKGSTQ